MLLKPADLVIDPQDPFKEDAFERKEVVEAFVNLIGTLSGPFVLAVDSPWGTGKTTFLKMLAVCLENAGHSCLSFNAWETDFAEDPLIAFVGEMDELIRKVVGEDADKHGYLKTAKRLGGALAKRAIPAAVKLSTLGALDLDKEYEKVLADATGALAENAVDVYLKDRKHIDEFHKTIDQALTLVAKEGKKLPLVFIVDELDRCRPLYAIELLERIKHLFNVEKAIFVLALDKEQLGISLSAVYGQGFNSNEYLRRFFDMEFLLSKVDSATYCDGLIRRMSLDTTLNSRPGDHINLRQAFTEINKLFELTPRTQERLMTLIATAIATASNTDYLYPEMLVLLAAVKLKDPQRYIYAIQPGHSVMELINFIFERENANGRLTQQFRNYLLSHLLAFRSASDTQANNYFEELIVEIRKGQTGTRSNQDAHGLIDALRNTHVLPHNMQVLVKRIDLAAQFSPNQT